ncbi:MAG: response regulator [Rhodothermales bacterium]
MSCNILFVDDQPELLRGTRRMLFSVDHDWHIDFALGGEEALRKLEEEHFDIVVSDMKMPGMDGAVLLANIAAKYPSMIRIIMSGYAEETLVMKTVENAHQFLAKPINGKHLVEVLNRAISLRKLLHDKRLADIVGGLDSIPSLPSAYMELMEVLQAKGSSMNDVGNVISKDIAMSAKIMQMVNSAFFGLPVVVKNPVHATNLLGAEVIKALVVSVHVFKSFSGNKSKRFSIDSFTNHSLAVGALAKALAKKERQTQDVVDDAFIAGMMHDVGKLIVASNFPEYYDQSTAYAEEQGLTYVNGEEVIFNTTHAEIGAYLLGLWGFRDNIVEAVAFHHRPSDCLGTTFSPLTAVHIADALENEYGSPTGPSIATIHVDYLIRLGLIDKLGDWRQVCLETQHTLMQNDE